MNNFVALRRGGSVAGGNRAGGTAAAVCLPRSWRLHAVGATGVGAAAAAAHLSRAAWPPHRRGARQVCSLHRAAGCSGETVAAVHDSGWCVRRCDGAEGC